MLRCFLSSIEHMFDRVEAWAGETRRCRGRSSSVACPAARARQLARRSATAGTARRGRTSGQPTSRPRISWAPGARPVPPRPTPSCTATPTSASSTGPSHPEELVEEAVRLGLEALALTDHDGMYGVVRFAEAAAAVGLPTVFGAELSLGPDPPPERAWPTPKAPTC